MQEDDSPEFFEKVAKHNGLFTTINVCNRYGEFLIVKSSIYWCPHWSLLNPRVKRLAFHLTFRVAEPAGTARRLRFSANDVTDQGLGEATNEVRSVAGKPVLCDGPSPRRLPRWQAPFPGPR